MLALACILHRLSHRFTDYSFTKGTGTTMQDQDERLINEAHAIFSLNSVHEVIDLDRECAVERLIYFCGPGIDMEKVDKYLAVVAELLVL